MGLRPIPRARFAAALALTGLRPAGSSHIESHATSAFHSAAVRWTRFSWRFAAARSVAARRAPGCTGARQAPQRARH